MFDKLPELDTVRCPPEKPDGNAERAFVSSPAPVGFSPIVGAERLFEPRARIDAGRMSSKRSLDGLLPHHAVDDDRVDVFAPDQEVGGLTDGVPIGLGDEPHTGHRKTSSDREGGKRACDDIHGGGGDETSTQVGEEIAVADLGDLSGGAEITWTGHHEVVGVGGETVHESSGDTTVFFDVAVERGELGEVVDEDGGGGADVEAKVDEAGLDRDLGAMVVDDGEGLDPFDVGVVGVEVVGVDEGDEVDGFYLAEAFELAHIDTEELDEGAVFSVAKLVAVADGGGAHADALGDVHLRKGTCDGIWIWMPTQGKEQVFSFGCGERLFKGSGS